MWVTIWRHGEAAPGAIDEYRHLTESGRRSLQAVLARYRAQCEQAEVPLPDRLDFSPLVRTTQTAEIIALGLGLESVACAALAPGAEVAQSAGLVTESASHQVLVSHQPFVSELVNCWLDSREVPPLMPGGYACIKLLAPARGGGTLSFATPSIL